MYLVGYYKRPKMVDGMRVSEVRIGIYSQPQDTQPVTDLGTHLVGIPKGRKSEEDVKRFLEGFICGVVSQLSPQDGRGLGAIVKPES